MRTPTGPVPWDVVDRFVEDATHRGWTIIVDDHPFVYLHQHADGGSVRRTTMAVFGMDMMRRLGGDVDMIHGSHHQPEGEIVVNSCGAWRKRWPEGGWDLIPMSEAVDPWEGSAPAEGYVLVTGTGIDWHTIYGIIRRVEQGRNEPCSL